MLGFLAVILWSTAPVAAGLLRDVADSYRIVYFMWIIGIVILTAINLSNLKEFRNNIDKCIARKSHACIVGVAGLSAMAYYIFLYEGLQIGVGVRSEVIALNYLWPIAYMAIISRLGVRQNVSMKSSDWCFVLLAFVSAAFVAMAPDHEGSLVKWHGIHDYHLLGVIAAGCAGLYLALFHKVASEGLPYRFSYWLALMLSLPVLLAIGWFRGDLNQELFRDVPFLVLYLSAIVFCCGQLAWLRAVHTFRSSSLSALSFATPLLAVVWLSLFLGEQPTLYYAYGAAGLIVSIFLTYSAQMYYGPPIGVAAIVLASGCLVLLGRPLSPEKAVVLNIVILAPFIALFVHCYNGSRESWRTVHCNATQAMQSNVELWRCLCRGANASERSRVTSMCDALLVAVSSALYAPENKIPSGTECGIHAAIERLSSAIAAQKKPDYRSTSLVAFGKLKEDSGRLVRSMNDNNGEHARLPLIVFFIIGVFGVIIFRHDSVFGDLAAIAVSGACAWLYYLYRDTAKGRPSNMDDVCRRIKKYYDEIGKPVCVLRISIDSGYISPPSKPMTVRVVESVGSLDAEVVNVNNSNLPYQRHMNAIAVGLIAIGIALLAVLLYIKHK